VSGDDLKHGHRKMTAEQIAAFDAVAAEQDNMRGTSRRSAK